MDKIKPKRGGVVIEPIAPPGEVATKSGLYMPPSAIDKNVLPKGKVVAVGASIFLSNGREVPPLYEVGETVYYSKASKAVELTLNGKECLLLTENEIHYGDDDAPKPLYPQPEAKTIMFVAPTEADFDGSKHDVFHDVFGSSLGSKVGKSTPKNS